MARVLLLARFFPPMGGAGVHRTLGSVRYLPHHGYQPVVVTGPVADAPRNRWEPADPRLLRRVPGGLEVHRVPATHPKEEGARIARLLARRSRFARWWVEESARLAVSAGRGADVVLAACAPYETAYAGARVARELGCPWIADLDDPWALDEMRVAPSGIHRAIDLHRMRRALASASAIVMTAPEAAERVRSAMPELASRVTAIPIGFEPSDFPTTAPAAPDGVFRIVHTGSLHTDFGRHLRRTRLRRRILGGCQPGLDVLTRSHVFLVEAIERLIRQDTSLSGRIELQLAGDLTDEDRAVSRRHGFVRELGLLSHERTVEVMRGADLLFLPMHDLPPGVRAGLIPYKTYEYVAAGRPILAAVPDGDVRDMLAPLPNAALVMPHDVDGMVEALKHRIRVARGGREVDVAPPSAWERHHSVTRLAGVLDQVRTSAGATSPRTSVSAYSHPWENPLVEEARGWITPHP